MIERKILLLRAIEWKIVTDNDENDNIYEDDVTDVIMKVTSNDLRKNGEVTRLIHESRKEEIQELIKL